MNEPSIPPDPDPNDSGLSLVARVTLVTAASLVAVAMMPCFGWLNWLVAPACLVPVVVGAIGLGITTSSSEGAHPGPFLAALIGGLLLMAVSGGRLTLGLGVF